jgi:RNA polymerase sigma factor (sigma-70 family)
LLVIYNTFYVGLVNYGIKLTGDRDLTKDCITQILLRLWDKKMELPDVENIRAYLTTCLRNELLTELKTKKLRKIKHQGLLKEMHVLEAPYEELLIQRQQNLIVKQKLKCALDKLTQRQKELLQLKYFEDLDYDEIAFRCNISKRTAYNLIQNGLINLKKNLFEDHLNSISPLSGTLPYLLVWLILVLTSLSY